MDKQVKLEARDREVYGRNAVRRLRRDGLIPAVMYGHGEDSRSLMVPEQELSHLLGRISVENTLVDLNVGSGEAQKVLIREVQRHPWKAKILHVDFFRIQADEEIRVAVPLRLEGTPFGVRNSGAILQQSRYELEVQCLPMDIPEVFVHDVTDLDIGDVVHVSDLDTGSVVPLEDPELTICTVVPPTVIQVVEEEEELGELEEMEPEVIGKGPDDEEGEEEEGEGAE
jgi:large subunit ribosomal protein L25